MAADARVITADVRAVRELVERAEGPGKVLSIVVDLNPENFADLRARRTQLTSLLDRARREIAAEENLGHEARTALERDLERVKAFATSDALPTDGVSAVAIFASEPRDMFDVVRLTLPASPEITVADDPAVETLAPYLSLDVWGLLLVNSRTARVFLGRFDMLRETEQLDDDVHRRHKQGGWSQARYQRSVEEEIEAHLRRSCERFAELALGMRVDHAAIAAPEAVRGQIDRLLPEALRARLAGMIDVDVEHTNEDEVVAALLPLADEVENHREATLLDRLREQLGTGGRAVAGPPDVSKALAEKRVDAVLMDATLELPRTVVEDAVLRDASLVMIRHHDDLSRLGGIAALLRF
jgi:peptide chain release factor subunit 1